MPLRTTPETQDPFQGLGERLPRPDEVKPAAAPPAPKPSLPHDAADIAMIMRDSMVRPPKPPPTTIAELHALQAQDWLAVRRWAKAWFGVDVRL